MSSPAGLRDHRRHSGTLRPASEMGLAITEGRRRGLKVFFFLPRELALGGISVASLTSHHPDTFQRRVSTDLCQ